MPPPRRAPRGQPGGRPQHQPPGELKGRLSLARALSKFGVCSRREACRWIEAGRVAVNGESVLWPARRIDPRADVVRVDGRRVRDLEDRLVLALHKPAGYITSRVDPRGRPTVYDLLGDVGRWVFPIGRLDLDTSGLLLMTNDHRLGERLSHPDSHVPKTYHARVAGLPDREALAALREGVDIGGYVTRPAKVRLLGGVRDGTSWLELVLTEGKNRQVRKMCASVGHDVVELVRTRIGPLELGDLAPREWRELPLAVTERLTERAAEAETVRKR